jgi:mono/diheme cytochrome c family protein
MTHPRPLFHRRGSRQAAAGLLAALLAGATLAANPADLLAGYTAEAGAPAQAARGQAFFNARHGKDWSCASCHGAVPSQAGKHASTGKTITALAPAFNPARFSDPAKVEKWFRRNCNDVADRACTPGEKADVLAWLISLRP